MSRPSAVVAVLAAQLALPLVAYAHLGHVVQRAERYVKLDVTGHTLRVVVSLSLGPDEMARVLEAADGNGDGEVTREEADAYMVAWGEALSNELDVTIDAEPTEMTFAAPFLEPLGPVRAISGTVEMVAAREVRGGTRDIELKDRMRRDPFDRTDVAFTARDGASFCDGASAEPIFFGRTGPTTFATCVDVPASPKSGASYVALAAFVALAIVGAGATVLVRRRQRR